MDMISELVKNICVFMLLTTVVNNLLQDSIYRKYIRLYVGIVVIILVINPVLSIFSMDMDFESNIEKYMADTKLDEIYDGMLAGEEQAYGQIITEYEKVLDNTMNNVVGKYGLYVVESGWNIENNPEKEFGKIYGVNLSLAYIDDVGYVVKDSLYEDIEEEFDTGRESVYIEII